MAQSAVLAGSSVTDEPVGHGASVFVSPVDSGDAKPAGM